MYQWNLSHNLSTRSCSALLGNQSRRSKCSVHASEPKEGKTSNVKKRRTKPAAGCNCSPVSNQADVLDHPREMENLRDLCSSCEMFFFFFLLPCLAEDFQRKQTELNAGVDEGICFNTFYLYSTNSKETVT